MAEDKSQKTEKPTPTKLKQAREEGNVARTPDLSGWLTVVVGAATITYLVGQLFTTVQEMMARARDVIASPLDAQPLEELGGGLVSWLYLVVPIGVACMIVGALGHIVQGGGKAYAKRLKPKWKKLNVLEGIKQLFSAHSAWNFAKSLIKFVVFGWVAYDAVQGTIQEITGSGVWSLSAIIEAGSSTALGVLWKIALIGLVIALADYMMEKRRVMKSLMMTKDEVRREHKQQEGSPELKGAIRARQREMGQRRMMAAIEEATVLIVNPTHVSVALKYEAGEGAPQVIAKGTGHLATRMREEAEAHQVPLVQDALIARMLYKACEVDDYIPLDLYDAVAQVLAFVMFLEDQGRSAGTHPSPVHEPNVPIPEEYDDKALGIVASSAEDRLA